MILARLSRCCHVTFGAKSRVLGPCRRLHLEAGAVQSSSSKSYSLRKILGHEDRFSAGDMNDGVIQWLGAKGYSITDVKTWQKLLQAPMYDHSIAITTRIMPAYVLLRLIEKTCHSRELFLKYLELWHASRASLDDSSQFHGLRKLIRAALKIDPALLSALDNMISDLPSSTTGFMFNRLLRITASQLRRHSAVGKFQSTITREMSSRHLHLNTEGCEALITGCADLSGQADMLAELHAMGTTSSKSYLLDHSLFKQPRMRGKHINAEVLPAIRSAASLNDVVGIIESDLPNLKDHRIWAELLARKDFSHDISKIFLDLVHNGTLTLSSFLCGMLFRSARNRGDLDDYCTIALEAKTPFTSFVWLEYLRGLVKFGDIQEALSIVSNEPGGNFLLDLAPISRRDPRIWSMLVNELNFMRRSSKISATKYVRDIGALYQGSQSHGVPISPPLLIAFANAALLSGSRRWQGIHCCDAVVKLFESNYHEGSALGKFTDLSRLWRPYMIVLLANEEVDRLIDAMRCIIDSKQQPDRFNLSTFALGIWESGQIELIDEWQSYIDEIGLQWPTAEQTFRHRTRLNSNELRFFNES